VRNRRGRGILYNAAISGAIRPPGEDRVRGKHRRAVHLPLKRHRISRHPTRNGRRNKPKHHSTTRRQRIRNRVQGEYGCSVHLPFQRDGIIRYQRGAGCWDEPQHRRVMQVTRQGLATTASVVAALDAQLTVGDARPAADPLGRGPLCRAHAHATIARTGGAARQLLIDEASDEPCSELRTDEFRMLRRAVLRALRPSDRDVMFGGTRWTTGLEWVRGGRHVGRG
jgi:hypothetical protein